MKEVVRLECSATEIIKTVLRQITRPRRRTCVMGRRIWTNGQVPRRRNFAEERDGAIGARRVVVETAKLVIAFLDFRLDVGDDSPKLLLSLSWIKFIVHLMLGDKPSHQVAIQAYGSARSGTPWVAASI